MNRTSSYNLCQWEETDRVRRTDFNEDNVKIDQALGALRDGKAEAAALSALSVAKAGKGNCRVAAGSYTGSGTFGENSPNTLTFPFKPLLVVISANSGGGIAVLIPGTEEYRYITDLVHTWSLTWTGNSVSWYIKRVNWASGSSGSPSDYSQMNVGNMVYRYVVFGKND